MATVLALVLVISIASSVGIMRSADCGNSTGIAIIIGIASSVGIARSIDCGNSVGIGISVGIVRSIDNGSVLGMLGVFTLLQALALLGVFILLPALELSPVFELLVVYDNDFWIDYQYLLLSKHSLPTL